MLKTKLEVRVKDGKGGAITLPPGLPVTFSPDGSRCLIPHNSRPEKPYNVRVTSCFKSPSVRSLENWSNDGVCQSVGGKRVEPDGWDENGSPSWLLALGMI